MSLLCEEVLTKIEALVAAIDPNKPDRKIVHIFKIKINQNGETVKTVMLDLVSVRFYEGDDDAECTITLDDQLLVDIVSKVKDANEAIQEGLIQAEGNLDLLQILKEQLVSLG